MQLFSVLMSVYFKEQPDYLRQSLDSIFEQTVIPNEVVLVEDGPLTKELYAVIEKYKAQHDTLKIVQLEQNVGLGEALNRGLAQCTYELVARMDSDDICVNDRFESQLKIFEQHPELSVVGGWVDEFSNDSTVVDGVRKLPENHKDIINFVRYRNPINHPTVMFRKRSVIAVGGYLHFYLLEDYWLWVRMIHYGCEFYNLQRVLVHMRGGVEMTARRGGWKYAVSELKFFKRLYGLKLIGIGDLIKNIIIRFPIRIMPNKMRTFVYTKLLR